jgi:hypothetical protein
MISKLDGFKSVEKVKGLSTNYVYKFSFKSKDPVYVIWSDNNSQINLSSEISGEIKITDVNQNIKNSNSSKIDIGTSPIYVEQI